MSGAEAALSAERLPMRFTHVVVGRLSRVRLASSAKHSCPVDAYRRSMAACQRPGSGKARWVLLMRENIRWR